MKLLTFNGKNGYKKLHVLPFNRKFNIRETLVRKMNEYGFIVPIILIKTDLITGIEELFIADGQHRAAAADYLDIPFYGVLSDIKFKSTAEIVKYVASLNSTQKPWVDVDYVTAYTYLGYPEYIILNRYKQKSSYSLSATAAMLTGIRSKGGAPRTVKEGTFKAYLTKELDYTLELSAKLSKFGKLTNRMGLGLHYVASLRSFDEKRFIKEYEKNYDRIVEMSLDDFSDIFESWIK